MAFYEVKVIASVVMLVEADTEDEAATCASDDVDFWRAGHKETQPPRLLSTDEEIDRVRRHADQISQD
ncbi:MAG: hypothetical protein PHU77_00305 [Simplicispira sp.]|nr:hypothetical protein [Simplicispira sp.]